ncbi:ABC transporter substrate-binding protein [Cohnella sp. CFH 77786]|uniref:ABC transporter substrate-binding protein n=1 Tax=Cohnella sp. CFH 77786 TaxID=2662265 RepID=UPI001C60F9E3|nr:ABC transporter substrate-binding protein [Cohnella sp. CFH 77786]MBW5445178.1 ABC transporter substrate-binding protein [Cohnella sp. CFH 77786]
MIVKGRKLSFVLSVLCLVLVISACSGGSNDAKNTSSASNSPSGSSGSEQLPELTIDVLSMLTDYAGPQEGWFAKIVKDKFNIKLNLVNSTGEVVPSRMASGDLGDLVVFGNENRKEYSDSIQGGLLLDWTKDGLLDKYGTNIKKYASKGIEANMKMFGDGKHVYGIGESVGDGEGSSELNKLTMGPSIRWDLYQKLGSPKITKLEDYLPLLKKMQELEPKSDSGRKTYGFSLWSDWDGNFMNLARTIGSYYGYQGGDGFNPGDMLLVSATEPKYQGLLDENGYYIQGLQFYNKANQMGLLDPDSVTQKFGDVANKLKDGQVFFTPWTWLDDTYNTENHTSAGKGIMPVPFAEEKAITFGYTPYGGERKWAIGAKAKDPARVLMLIDWLYSPEGMMVLQNGPKGLTWDLKDGKPYVTEFGWKAYQNPDTEVPAEYGGNTYKNGSVKINNSTLNSNLINPETGEPYHHDMWSSTLDHQPNPVLSSWREAMGAKTMNEYYTKNNMIAVTKQTFTGEPPVQLTTDIQQKQNEVGKVIKEFSWKMVIAKNDADFNKLKQQMIEKAKGLGYDEVLAWEAEQTKKTAFAQNP